MSWLEADAERLPLADASVDSYTIAFGLRNVTRPEAALADAARVLRRGGRLLVLEFSHVQLEPLRAAYDAYSFAAIPAMGRLVVRARIRARMACMRCADNAVRTQHMCADGGCGAVPVPGGEHPPVRDARRARGDDAGAAAFATRAAGLPCCLAQLCVLQQRARADGAALLLLRRRRGCRTCRTRTSWAASSRFTQASSCEQTAPPPRAGRISAAARVTAARWERAALRGARRRARRAVQALHRESVLSWHSQPRRPPLFTRSRSAP